MAVTLSPVDGVTVTTLVDNSADVLMPDEGLVRRWGLAGTAGPMPVVPNGMAIGGASVDFLRAEHGYSALVEVQTDGRRRRVLFDTGITTDGLIGNLDRLDLDPATFEAIVFSHGHFDHVMGLDGLARRMGRSGLPVLLHPDFWTRRRIAGPDGVFDLPSPSRAAIEGAGFVVIEDRKPSFLLDGMLLVTGEVERVTPFETGMPAEHEAWRGDRWEHDPLVHEDQAVVLNVRDKGLVILTGCGHAGIVNIVRHAKRLTGIEHVHAVLGGLHLRGGKAVPATVAALATEALSVLVPAHCTSWSAQHALAAGLPEAFRPNAVGSQFAL
ncbi:MBL fold metallo-hydrolase [Virgisporangium aliadipatigenens]|uniref:MBL fold metallo-hydrolase n=1 Tax=Virgisporangium aliadipatigenens TaxID=741659 RepID=A0A8J4DV14_9ACTN|nr:MBL fold metallo-hydrolase [Virgisporangium aliadipatigenens]GIJ50668.1 MBL fold metallo-hydrolase [Virgisporangium aliadipatigenens]